MFAPRQLLARLRVVMASAVPGVAVLPRIARLVSVEMDGQACAIYVLHAGDSLERVASEPARSAGPVRLRVGEGLVGLAAAGAMLNLPDVQTHPAYAPHGEDPPVSLLALPVRRAGRVLGVLALQSRAFHAYDETEVEVLETVCMVVAEVLAAAGTVEEAELTFTNSVQRRFTADMAVPGLVVGPVVRHGTAAPPSRLLTEDIAGERKRLDAALIALQRGIDALARTLPLPANSRAGTSHAATHEILAAYRLVAADTSWISRVKDLVATGLTAEAAVYRIGGEMRERMRRVADPYLRERLADLEDLAGRLLAALRGDPPRAAEPGAILVARRLGPADLLEWRRTGIAGLAIEQASPAGHAAIIARALGLPTLVGADGLVDACVDGDEAVLNADDGLFILRPPRDAAIAYAKSAAVRAHRDAAPHPPGPLRTADGTEIHLLLNLGLPHELNQLDLTGADGIGLYRTEIAMLAAGTVLTEAEQTALYRRVIDDAGGRPAYFRTLDLGADKLLPFAPQPAQENPAMGWRSLRLGLDRPRLLRSQLSALVAAADGRPLSVMFPMVATVEEFQRARALLLSVCDDAPIRPARLEIGAMLEVPSLLFQLPHLLNEADFLSVGTNDLLQFLFAADRGTPGLAARYDLLSPPVLDVLETIVHAAAAAGTSLSLCGAAAARPLDAAVLAALGFRALSMPPAALGAVRAALEATKLDRLRAVLATLRAGAGTVASLRLPLRAWGNEHGIPL